MPLGLLAPGPAWQCLSHLGLTMLVTNGPGLAQLVAPFPEQHSRRMSFPALHLLSVKSRKVKNTAMATTGHDLPGAFPGLANRGAGGASSEQRPPAAPARCSGLALPRGGGLTETPPRKGASPSAAALTCTVATGTW